MALWKKNVDPQDDSPEAKRSRVHWIDPETGSDIEETMALENGNHRFDRPPGYGEEAAFHLPKIESESQM